MPEPDITEYMETFDRDIHFNPWIDPLPDIPPPIQQDHLQSLLPHPLVTRVDSCNWVDNQDAVASGHTQGHNRECGDVSRGWCLEAPFEAQNFPPRSHSP